MISAALGPPLLTASYHYLVIARTSGSHSADAGAHWRRDRASEPARRRREV